MFHNIVEDKDKSQDNGYVVKIFVIEQGKIVEFSKRVYPRKNDFDLKDIKDIPQNVFSVEVYRKSQDLLASGNERKYQNFKRYIFGRYYPTKKFSELMNDERIKTDDSIKGYVVCSDGEKILGLKDEAFKNSIIVDNRRIVEGELKENLTLDDKPYPKRIIDSMLKNNLKSDYVHEYHKIRFENREYKLALAKTQGLASHYVFIFDLFTPAKFQIGRAVVRLCLNNYVSHICRSSDTMKCEPEIYFELESIAIKRQYRGRHLGALLMNETLSFIKHFNKKYCLTLPLTIRRENSEITIPFYDNFGAVDNDTHEFDKFNNEYTNLIIENVSPNKERYPYLILDKHLVFDNKLKFIYGEEEGIDEKDKEILYI